MRKVMAVLLGLGLMLSAGLGFSQDKDSKKIDALVKKYLPAVQKVASDPAVVADVEAQNAQKITLAQADEIEADWAKIGVGAMVKPHLNLPSCKTLKDAMTKNPAFVKCFTMDNQGNVVATVPKSKNFIHRQDKFVKCYNKGDGKMFIDKPKLDVSTKIYSIQIALPINNGGKTVGVMIATLSLE